MATQNDPTTWPLRANSRRPWPWLSLRRRHLPSCGAKTHPFSSHPAIDASNTSACRAWDPRRPPGPQRPHSKRATRPVRGPRSALGHWGRTRVVDRHDSSQAAVSRHALVVPSYLNLANRFGWPFRHQGYTLRLKNDLGWCYMTQTRPGMQKSLRGKFCWGENFKTTTRGVFS